MDTVMAFEVEPPEPPVPDFVLTLDPEQPEIARLPLRLTTAHNHANDLIPPP
jgi:hypothetical protein